MGPVSEKTATKNLSPILYYSKISKILFKVTKVKAIRYKLLFMHGHCYH